MTPQPGDPDAATLLQWYGEALAARHQLMTGQSLVRIRHGDREMSYTSTSLGSLNDYLTDLGSQLAALGIKVKGPRRGRSRSIVF